MLNMRNVLILLAALVTVACSGPEQRADKYMAKANASFEAGDFVKAELDAKNTLQIEPQNADARMLLAKIAEQELLTNPDKWREMMAQLQRVVELDPQNVEARIKLAQLYMRFIANASDKQQIFDMIRDQVESAKAVKPDDSTVQTLETMLAYHEANDAGDSEAVAAAIARADALFDEDPTNLLATSFLAGYYAASDKDLAVSYIDRSLEVDKQPALRVLKIGLMQAGDDLAGAEQEYKKLIEENPENDEVKYGLVRFYAESGQAEKAESMLRDLVAADDDNAEAKLQLARFKARSGDVDGAEQILRAAMEAHPDNYDFPFTLSQLHLQQERQEAAEELLNEISESAGATDDGLKARNQMARIRLSQERKADAEAIIDTVLEDEAANSSALLMKAALQLERSETDSAIANLRTALRNDPTSEQALTLLARAQIVANDYDLAKVTYQRLVAAHPNNAAARRELARLMSRERQWDELRNLLVDGIARHPDDVQMTRMLVDTLIRVNDWDTAQVQADRIVDKEETRPLGLYLQGRIHQARGRYQQSIDAFKQALELQPRAIEPLTNLVRSYVAMDDLDQAAADIEEFLANNDNHVHAQTLLAEVYARQQRWSDAIAANDTALNIDARWVPAYRNLIGLHLLRGDFNEAEKAANGALEVLPENADLRMLLATVYERQERFDEAIEIYAEEIRRNPDSEIAINNFAALVSDHTSDPARLGRALQLAQRFRNADNPVFLDTLGWLMYRNGQFDDAVKVLEQAVDGAPGEPQLRYHLGMAYYAVDRLEGAKSELQAAVAADRAFVGLEEARQTLELL
ncbi:MAG: tetratricopeptide repeat protein [Gammaproteobacteria bacterium]|nr:tetratricopeptide repeat protein [Gammaproteobacteria bacterium]